MVILLVEFAYKRPDDRFGTFTKTVNNVVESLCSLLSFDWIKNRQIKSFVADYLMKFSFIDLFGRLDFGRKFPAAG